MSTEPPSRLPPRGPSHESKAAKEEIAKQKKIEKVREVDADETRKRQKWQAAYEGTPDEAAETRPSLFDLPARNKPLAEERTLGKPPVSQSDMKDVEEAIIPSPPLTSPPDLTSYASAEDSLEDDEATTGALPQSNDFWEDVDFPPDQPMPQSSFQEMPGLSQKTSSSRPSNPETKTKKSPPQAEPLKMGHSSPLNPPSKKESSPFGPPGKPLIKGEKNASPSQMDRPPPVTGQKPPEKKKSPSLYEETLARAPQKPRSEAEEKRVGGFLEPPLKPEKKGTTERKREEGYVFQEPQAAPLKSEDQEQGEKKGKEQKTGDIPLISSSNFPNQIQSAAVAATSQATPYLHPSTIPLFFQMVGTMYMMAGPQGISRTEILLNQPSFADSRFYGSTIKIEKYATAPDSFNITLSGSDQAVTAFKENIPSLMAAFQNGSFSFRVNRLDVEYSAEKPLFRRKGKEDERDNTDGNDSGERRK